MDPKWYLYNLKIDFVTGLDTFSCLKYQSTVVDTIANNPIALAKETPQRAKKT